MPIESHPEGGATLTGNAVNWFAVKVVCSAMKLYLRTGVQANRAYTPQAMRGFASRHTGMVYPRSKQGLQQAFDELTQWISKLQPDEVPTR